MSLWRPDIAPDREPYKILIKKGVFTDEARNGRTVPFKLYHPVSDGLTDLPVVVWSHGLGGNANGASFLARYVSSHGYIVLHLQHPGTDSSLWEGKPGHPWDVIRATPIPRSASIDRFLDVPFALDALAIWAKDYPDVGIPMDLSRVGMCGHSFGALTTQVVAGQMFPDADETLQSYSESRFRAGILYSPVPVRHLTHASDTELYGSIQLPLLHMTGTEDASPVEKFGYRERLAVYEHSFRAPRSLLILQGGDHMVYAGSRGQLEENPLRPLHEDFIKIFSLAWWDAHLRGDEDAKAWLDEGGAASYINGRGEWTP